MLRALEWQTETSPLTLRVRGKQWYWVYKFDLNNSIYIDEMPYLIGRDKKVFFTKTNATRQERLTKTLSFKYFKNTRQYAALEKSNTLKNRNENFYQNNGNVIKKSFNYNFLNNEMVGKFYKKNTTGNITPQLWSIIIKKFWEPQSEVSHTDWRNIVMKHLLYLSTPKLKISIGQEGLDAAKKSYFYGHPFNIVEFLTEQDLTTAKGKQLEALSLGIKKKLVVQEKYLQMLLRQYKKLYPEYISDLHGRHHEMPSANYLLNLQFFIRRLKDNYNEESDILLRRFIRSLMIKYDEMFDLLDRGLVENKRYSEIEEFNIHVSTFHALNEIFKNEMGAAIFKAKAIRETKIDNIRSQNIKSFNKGLEKYNTSWKNLVDIYYNQTKSYKDISKDNPYMDPITITPYNDFCPQEDFFKSKTLVYLHNEKHETAKFHRVSVPKDFFKKILENKLNGVIEGWLKKSADETRELNKEYEFAQVIHTNGTNALLNHFINRNNWNFFTNQSPKLNKAISTLFQLHLDCSINTSYVKNSDFIEKTLSNVFENYINSPERFYNLKFPDSLKEKLYEIHYPTSIVMEKIGNPNVNNKTKGGTLLTGFYGTERSDIDEKLHSKINQQTHKPHTDEFVDYSDALKYDEETGILYFDKVTYYSIVIKQKLKKMALANSKKKFTKELLYNSYVNTFGNNSISERMASLFYLPERELKFGLENKKLSLMRKTFAANFTIKKINLWMIKIRMQKELLNVAKSDWRCDFHSIRNRYETTGSVKKDQLCNLYNLSNTKYRSKVTTRNILPVANLFNKVGLLKMNPDNFATIKSFYRTISNGDLSKLILVSDLKGKDKLKSTLWKGGNIFQTHRIDNPLALDIIEKSYTIYKYDNTLSELKKLFSDTTISETCSKLIELRRNKYSKTSVMYKKTRDCIDSYHNVIDHMVYLQLVHFDIQKIISNDKNIDKLWLRCILSDPFKNYTNEFDYRPRILHVKSEYRTNLRAALAEVAMRAFLYQEDIPNIKGLKDNTPQMTHLRESIQDISNLPINPSEDEMKSLNSTIKRYEDIRMNVLKTIRSSYIEGLDKLQDSPRYFKLKYYSSWFGALGLVQDRKNLDKYNLIFEADWSKPIMSSNLSTIYEQVNKHYTGTTGTASGKILDLIRSIRLISNRIHKDRLGLYKYLRIIEKARLLEAEKFIDKHMPSQTTVTPAVVKEPTECENALMGFLNIEMSSINRSVDFILSSDIIIGQRTLLRDVIFDRWTKNSEIINAPLVLTKSALSSSEPLSIKFLHNKKILRDSEDNTNATIVQKKVEKTIFSSKLDLREVSTKDGNALYKERGGLILANPGYADEHQYNFKTRYRLYGQKDNMYTLEKSYADQKRLLWVNKQLILPINIAITIITNSYDVIHSWFIPGLGLKLDCVPGRATHHTIYIDHTGYYYGQCAEVCGRRHHHMPIKILAVPLPQFIYWWNTNVREDILE